MTAFQLAMFILSMIQAVAAGKNDKTSSAVVSGIEGLTKLYNDLVAAAKQNAELTADEEALLDQHAQMVLSGPAADPTKNV